jgi:hypothetical protein
MSRIRLTIDHLALKGFDPAEKAALVDGLRTELERVLANRNPRAQWRARRTPVMRLNVPSPSGSPGRKALGAAVARAIVRSVKP